MEISLTLIHAAYFLVDKAGSCNRSDGGEYSNEAIFMMKSILSSGLVFDRQARQLVRNPSIVAVLSSKAIIQTFINQNIVKELRNETVLVLL